MIHKVKDDRDLYSCCYKGIRKMKSTGFGRIMGGTDGLYMFTTIGDNRIIVFTKRTILHLPKMDVNT